MFARIAKICRSNKTTTPVAAERPALLETLEDRQMYSVSPVAVSSFSWGATNTGSYLHLPAVQQPVASTNIIGVLIAL